jgi:hypothetical protein
MSLELMLYASLAGLSLVFALGEVARESTRISNGTVALEASQFVNSLNAELLNGGTQGFTLFVPQGLCNSKISGDELSYGGAELYLVEPLALSGNPLCPDGTSASFSVICNKTGVYLARD